MPITKLVVSDLHLADGASILECFGERQQSAFEGLLQSQTGNVELIINGDCFDFLITPPYDLNGVTDVATTLQKLEKIIAAHYPFFAVLRSFIEQPEHAVTFIMGNHDVELCFVQVQSQISTAITGTPSDPRVRFCTTRSYRPLADVYIEHGNYYDFWNHAQQGMWDDGGQPVAPSPSSIVLPVGSRYFQHATHPVSLKYAYFDHFEPSINSTRQIALLSLLDPQIIVDTAHLTAQLMSYPRTVLANLATGEESNPQRLFEETAMDFVAFQQDMVAHKTDWKPRTEDAQISPAAILEFSTLREALSLPLREAVASICIPVTYQMGESVARGMYNVLQDDSTLRYAIAGHTHMERMDPLNNGAQMYLNTASWTVRLALPAPNEIMSEHGPALLDWLRSPDWQHIPLRDVTQFIFALIHAEENGPSHATLCKWEGDKNGSYHVLTAV